MLVLHIYASFSSIKFLAGLKFDAKQIRFAAATLRV